jgi:outer membrane receptor protein involved in Fe transport
MRRDSRLSCAIAAVLGVQSTAVYAADAASGVDADASSGELEQITVTAQRRSENLQNVPITIQALTAETLTQLNVTTFDDFVRYLPNVTAASNGPGQGNVYMRGLSTGGVGNQGSGGVGTFPNVAIYLDEQSGQLPGRNLDIYAADLERIEVLEGPQGTLFGSGAEAGVLRYITNKPKLDVTEGSVDAGYAVSAHGDPSSNVTGVVNLPVIPDTLALRGVIYSDTRGGYINNVPGTFIRSSTDKGIHYAGYVNNVPSYSSSSPGSVNNNNLVANAINPVTYKGIRAEALYKFNDGWSALLAQSYQQIDAQGVFFEMPESSGPAVAPNPGGPHATALPDLSVQLYNPSYNKDRFENTSLTVEGRIADLKLVYAGGYLVRHVEQVQDYTAYARGVYADYYQCVPGAGGGPGKCYSPSTTWQDTEKNSHDSQELRLSTPDDWRTRGIVGVFWEDYNIEEGANWLYKTAPGFAPLVPPPGATSTNPSVRNSNVAFFDDITRGYKQTAAFGSMDFDIVPKRLTVTVGTRYYHFKNTEVGSAVSSFDCYVGYTTTTPCSNYTFGTNLNAENLNSVYSGFRSRANLSFKATDDILIYYTWSQGFRPGGFNRTSKNVLGGTYNTPLTFSPDTLINNEFGVKSEWFDHHLEFNATVYQEDWKNVQIEVFDPQGGLGNQEFIANGPSYRVRGVETQLVARVTQGLTLTGSAAWNSGEQTNSPYLINIYGQPITSIPNPYGAVGSPLAQSPPFQANLRARYELTFNEYHPFAQVGGVHQSHSSSATGYVENFNQPGFTTYDAAVGVAKNAWLAQFYGENITDARYVTYINDDQFVPEHFVGRPRTMGLKFSYKF